ncbi:DUF4288 domain-containing protein [Ammoniphilus sp. CFH 90114]|uniref:DUF4288 domain-containing protein n=1 Tax=Ammoniphilus sp. CFH 90114 TaxID=2493665 RepID=UPI0013E91A56|nr:DUF4288 domain-containing protein [Ammoniphilus sp. CFH 90114]
MWYTASVLFRLEAIGELPTHCETLVLLKADSEDEAAILANQWGKEYEDEIWETDGKKTRWVYEQVLDLWELFDDEIRSGTEVYSRFWATPPYVE